MAINVSEYQVFTEAFYSRVQRIAQDTLDKPWVPNESKIVFISRVHAAAEEEAYKVGLTMSAAAGASYYALHVVEFDGIPLADLP